MNVELLVEMKGIEKAAEMLGCTTRTLVDFKNKKRTPTATMEKLASVLVTRKETCTFARSFDGGLIVSNGMAMITIPKEQFGFVHQMLDM